LALERHAPGAKWHRWATAFVAIVFSLPYRWLGLEQWYYYRNRPQWIDWRDPSVPAPGLSWIPKAEFFREQIPGEFVFFLVLLGLITGFGLVYISERKRMGIPLSSSIIGPVAAIALLPVATAALHLSLYSPSTYVSHFSQPPAANFWYHSLLFPNGMGAVNADYFQFRSIEDLFLGAPRPVSGMLASRPFPLYISSQFTSFVNPMYVMLAMNVLCWIAACLAMRDYVSGHFDERTANAAAMLLASAPGFAMFAAQPPTYIWGYAAVILATWMHWRICCRPNGGVRDYLYFGGLLGLAFLTYDLFALLVYLIGYEVLYRRSAGKILLSSSVALAIYTAFGVLTSRMPSIVPDARNSNFLSVSAHNFAEHLSSFPLALANYDAWAGLAASYFRNVANAFFVFPFLAAVSGIFLIRRSEHLRLTGLLALPSFCAFAFLYFGRTELATFARLTFVAYIAVYALCGIAVSRLSERLRRFSRFAPALAMWAAVAANAALTNADVFGYPWLYYLFYNQSANGASF
jgi:hypothetical protein